jgi:hypothetical protein
MVTHASYITDVELADVFFLGGAPGSGKTSISRALAYRHDLQLYNLDHRTWEHEHKLPPRPPRDWSLPAAELADVFVAYSHERWPLVLADLAELPPSAGAIAEGPHFLPELVPEGAHALFLVPTDERVRATREERGSRANLADRDVLLAQRFRVSAEERGFPVLPVDRPLAEMIELVDARVPSLPRAVDRPAIRRFENDVLARQVRLYRASGEAPAGDWALPFACECDEAGCSAIVELTLAEYDAVSASGDRSTLRRPRS